MKFIWITMSAVLCFSSCNHSQHNKQRSKISNASSKTLSLSTDTLGTMSIKRMDILYVEMDIDTFVSVSCDEFERAFSEYYKILIIRDSVTISQIMAAFSNAEINPNQTSIDSRRKLIIHWRNGIPESVCIDNFGFQRGAKIYKYNYNLREMIEKLIGNE